MIALRSFALLMFCISALSFSAFAAAQTTDTTPNGISENSADQAALQPYGAADNNQPNPSMANHPDRQRPVPKRLTAQERWNRMSVEQRSVIINEWQKLDETVRPVFPIYRDNALEQQAQQTLGGNAITPVTSPVSMPVPAPAQTADHDTEETQADPQKDHPLHGQVTAPANTNN